MKKQILARVTSEPAAQLFYDDSKIPANVSVDDREPNEDYLDPEKLRQHTTPVGNFDNKLPQPETCLTELALTEVAVKKEFPLDIPNPASATAADLARVVCTKTGIAPHRERLVFKEKLRQHTTPVGNFDNKLPQPETCLTELALTEVAVKKEFPLDIPNPASATAADLARVVCTKTGIAPHRERLVFKEKLRQHTTPVGNFDNKLPQPETCLTELALTEVAVKKEFPLDIPNPASATAADLARVVCTKTGIAPHRERLVFKEKLRQHTTPVGNFDNKLPQPETCLTELALTEVAVKKEFPLDIPNPASATAADLARVVCTKTGIAPHRERLVFKEKNQSSESCPVSRPVQSQVESDDKDEMDGNLSDVEYQDTSQRFSEQDDSCSSGILIIAESPTMSDVCVSIASVEGNAWRHALSHTEQDCDCQDCGAGFSGAGCLEHHSRKNTGEKPYKCDVCDSSFADSSQLKSHKRKHTGEKPYKCDVCEASFTCSSTLIYHKSTHTGEKPYKCDLCEASFFLSCNLTRHKITHTGEKPYKCDVCEASFTCSSTLLYHKNTHTVEKPYKCDVCEASFSRSDCLKCHKRLHTGEKPYACNICDRKFTNRSSLRWHNRTHTGDKPY